MIRRKVFCDMDGILVDFEKVADWDELPKDYFLTRPIKKGAKDLWDFLCKHRWDEYVLSARPRSMPQAIQHKIDWMAQQLNYTTRDHLIICLRRQKKLLAVSGGVSNILIDDSGDVIQAWKESGGIGILAESPVEAIIHLKNLERYLL